LSPKQKNLGEILLELFLKISNMWKNLILLRIAIETFIFMLTGNPPRCSSIFLTVYIDRLEVGGGGGGLDPSVCCLNEDNEML